MNNKKNKKIKVKDIQSITNSTGYILYKKTVKDSCLTIDHVSLLENIAKPHAFY